MAASVSAKMGFVRGALEGGDVMVAPPVRTVTAAAVIGSSCVSIGDET